MWRSYLFKSNKHEKLTFNWLGLEVHCGHLLTCNSVALLYLRTPVSCLDVISIYTLAFSPSFFLLYSLKTSSKTPSFSYCKTNNDFGKPYEIDKVYKVYEIDNKTPKVEKNLFARVNSFDQPIKTWDKLFLKLF